MMYFEYAIEIDEKGLRVLDPDQPGYFNPEYMFKQHAWLPGTVFSFEEHPNGGLWLKRLSGDDFKDKGL